MIKSISMHTYFHYPLYHCNKNHCNGIIVIKSFLFYSINSSQCIFAVKIVIQFNKNACEIISLATDFYRKNHLPCIFTMKCFLIFILFFFSFKILDVFLMSPSSKTYEFSKKVIHSVSYSYFPWIKKKKSDVYIRETHCPK